MVITASTNIITDAERPKDCAESIKLVIKPIVLKLCANTPAATKSITTPAKAREIGSDYIVVGRPITQAEDPVAAYRRCVSEFVG